MSIETAMVTHNNLYSLFEKRAGLNVYRDRATLMLHDGKGNVLAAKNNNPSIHDAPYFFPGGGIHKDESTDNPIPDNKLVEKGLKREALEELGYKVHKIEHLDHPHSENQMNPEWQRRVYKKRGEFYEGVREHIRAAQIAGKDTRLYNKEGDAFHAHNPVLVPAKEIAKSLRDHAGNEFIFDGKRKAMLHQADFLDKLHGKYSSK